ncbi:hypothetical protein [Bradyrhizobium sp. LTSPM299]|uniref:hypothetical protein n=1 Tax=Bradyrhizobium sp. LTSPM299 TaxID=1619233 RepID=UPI0012E2C2FC|nr:hypothetical protein [Bradyrhizobium sp. LTSPM299]
MPQQVERRLQAGRVLQHGIRKRVGRRDDVLLDRLASAGRYIRGSLDEEVIADFVDLAFRVLLSAFRQEARSQLVERRRQHIILELLRNRRILRIGLGDRVVPALIEPGKGLRCSGRAVADLLVLDRLQTNVASRLKGAASAAASFRDGLAGFRIRCVDAARGLCRRLDAAIAWRQAQV